jgi:hypothetical protein
MMSNDDLRNLIVEYLAMNRGPGYGIVVDRIASDQ